MPLLDSSASMEPAPQGFRFVLVDRPGGVEPRGSVVFAPPFAEEMNKSRRMVALAARALAEDGWRVVRADLFGCGDSSGDFGEASWSDWLQDLERVVDEARQAGGELWLWGLRGGALLLPPLLAAAPAANVLLWQPALSGSAVLNQFLRLKTVGGLAGAAPAGEDRQSLLQRLARGESIDVAGYRLSATLAAGLDAARLELPATHRGRTVWIEIGSADAPSLSPASTRLIDAWRQAGHEVQAESVSGLQFWQTVETSEVPALVQRTRFALAGPAAESPRPFAQRGTA